mmetsp:Transcript_2854/g.6676  ORF Transcript_2854/g.6676 Transcript_2854/m.6676 type:complete len:199 (-) Transcript_2854:588-1184(-)
MGQLEQLLDCSPRGRLACSTGQPDLAELEHGRRWPQMGLVSNRGKPPSRGPTGARLVAIFTVLGVTTTAGRDELRAPRMGDILQATRAPRDSVKRNFIGVPPGRGLPNKDPDFPLGITEWLLPPIAFRQCKAQGGQEAQGGLGAPRGRVHHGSPGGQQSRRPCDERHREWCLRGYWCTEGWASATFKLPQVHFTRACR